MRDVESPEAFRCSAYACVCCTGAVPDKSLTLGAYMALGEPRAASIRCRTPCGWARTRRSRDSSPSEAE